MFSLLFYSTVDIHVEGSALLSQCTGVPLRGSYNDDIDVLITLSQQTWFSLVIIETVLLHREGSYITPLACTFVFCCCLSSSEPFRWLEKVFLLWLPVFNMSYSLTMKMLPVSWVYLFCTPGFPYFPEGAVALL